MRKSYRILWKIFIIVILASMIIFTVLPLGSLLQADTLPYDLAVNSRGISFSDTNFYAGDTVRIYGTVENMGNKDVTGYVQFFKGTTPIGDSLAVSSKANGAPEEVWVDWVAEEGTYNIQFRILDSNPSDMNAANNQTVSPMFTVTKRPEPTPPPTPAPAPSSSPSSSSSSSNTSTSTTQAPTPGPKPTTTVTTNHNIVVHGNPVFQDPGGALPVNAQEAGNIHPTQNEGIPNTPADVSGGGAPNSASVTAVVPETAFNRPHKPWFSLDFLKNIDPYVLLMGGSLLAVTVLLLIAILFWKKSRQSKEEDEKKEEQVLAAKSTDDQINEFLTSDQEPKT